MIAILTKYLGPTNSRGSRIKAWTSNKGQSVTIGYDYALDREALHRKAAQALMNKMGWPNKLVSGGIEGGYAFVMLPYFEGGVGASSHVHILERLGYTVTEGNDVFVISEK